MCSFGSYSFLRTDGTMHDHDEENVQSDLGMVRQFSQCVLVKLIVNEKI